MKKQLFLLMLSVVYILSGCTSNNDGGGDLVPPSAEQLKQTTYADESSTGSGFSFTAEAPWTATVNEVEGDNNPPQANFISRAVTNNVVWLRLYLGSRETYSGEAGKVTLRIEVDDNYTGERRAAKVVISTGKSSFTVSVVQEGKKRNGGSHKPAVDVSSISLNKGSLSLKVGAKVRLIAKVQPENATLKKVSWSSDNPDVATVNPFSGEVTAKKEGTAKIKVTSVSNKKVFSTCLVLVEDNNTANPVSPEKPNKKLITKIQIISYHNAESTKVDYVETMNFFYDNQNRLIKIESLETDDDGDGNDETSRMTIKYGEKNISATAIHRDGDDWNCVINVTAMLDNKGRVISGNSTTASSDEKDNDETKFTISYDNEGRQVESREEHIDDKTKLVEWVESTTMEWTGNNPTKVTYDGKIGKNLKDTAVYGQVFNKANLDLNWIMLVPNSDGFGEAAVGDGVFHILGYAGKRSERMVTKMVTGIGSTMYIDDTSTYTYETDADGFVTKITRIDKATTHNGVQERNKYEYIITYNK